MSLERLSDLQQMCDAPSDAYDAGAWCSALNDAVQMLEAVRGDLLTIIDAAGQVRMFEGRSYTKLWKLVDAATDVWFLQDWRAPAGSGHKAKDRPSGVGGPPAFRGNFRDCSCKHVACCCHSGSEFCCCGVAKKAPSDASATL